jgi:hypothetical protein
MQKWFTYLALYHLLPITLTFKTTFFIMKKQVINILLILPVLAIILTACTERMNIKTDNQNPKLVVNAFLSTEQGEQKVILSKTVGYFGGEHARGVNDAQVWVNNVELSRGAEEGVYITANTFQCVAGEAYSLRILYDLDGDGSPEEFFADDVSPKTPSIFRDIELVPLDTSRIAPPFFTLVHLHRDLSEDYFSVEMYYNGRNLYRNIWDYPIGEVPYGWGDSVSFNLSLGKKRIIALDDTIFFCPFDTITYYAVGITKATANYVESVQQELNGSDPMFSGPPANVKFNIKGDNGIGLFGLRSISTPVSLVLPMTVTTVVAEWEDESTGARIKVEKDGYATLNGQIYFQNMTVESSIRGFTAVDGNGAPLSFRMNHYD